MITTRTASVRSNGQAKAKPRTASRERSYQRRKPARGVAATLAILGGVSTPLLALAMSTLTGHVAAINTVAATLPMGILICLLVVSTPHIKDATVHIGWKPWQAWAFAIALDCCITVSELISVWCPRGIAEIRWLPVTVIIGAVAYSAVLNCYVNLKHAKIVS